MKLSQLLSIFKDFRIGHHAGRDVENICVDHRKLLPNSIWVAIKGSHFDGHTFIVEACAKDALAIVAEDVSMVPKAYEGAVVKVKNSKKALRDLAAHFYSHPAEKLFCVGVTGTNGKTTITHMIENVLNHFGMPTGVLGTIDHHLMNHVWKSELTTPDSLTLHKRLSEFVTLGAKAVAFEVSSHALDQGRVDGIEFDAAIFSNLTRDHLDYHHSMQSYFEAKCKLFTELPLTYRHKNCRAIININDEWGKKIEPKGASSVWTYGESKSDFQFQITKSEFTGTEFKLSSPRGSFQGRLRVPGRHNVYNAVSALMVGLTAGASMETCLEALAEYKGVAGRLESVQNNKNLNIFVDYAHSEDSLFTVLSFLNEIRKASRSRSRIHVVFGCGGDRDKGKRPNMGRVAYENADFLYVTSDNPRTEDPDLIIALILEGIPNGKTNKKVQVEPDRRRAIEKALITAHADDVILIAGKGHEDYQIIGNNKEPFSDVLVAGEILSGM